jgi:hypothetical protein
MLPKPAPGACACLIKTPDRISERPPLLFLRKPPIASCLRSRAVAWLLPPKRPVDRDHANANKRHPNFRFDVRQEVRNPPWSASVPINERRIARREISVKPEGHTRRLDDPANDNCLIHNLDLYGRLYRYRSGCGRVGLTWKFGSMGVRRGAGFGSVNPNRNPTRSNNRTTAIGI